jgi:hypothetical protein
MVRRGTSNLGFLLNNELSDFNTVPQYTAPVPHALAPVNPGANDVAAGKRPRSSMAPTIIFTKDPTGEEQPILAFGSPGGSSIINTVLNVTLNLLDHGMAVQTAIDAPRLSLAGTGSTAAIEAGFDPAVLGELTALGYRFAAPAAIGVATVMGRAEREGLWWYYLDDGVYGNWSGRLYDHATYPIESLKQGGELRPSVLAGPTCDSIDVIAENILLPRLKAGDLIIGHVMGAYTWATASEFNYFPKPTVVSVNETPGDLGQVEE